MRFFPWTFLNLLGPNANKRAYSSIVQKTGVGERLKPLTMLEQGFLADTVNSLEMIFKTPIQPYWLNQSPPGFEEFSDPGKWPKYLEDGGLSYDEMRRVYLRRIAVLLWSEANEHWPWKASVGTDEELDLLYAWLPQPVPYYSSGGQRLDSPNGFLPKQSLTDQANAKAYIWSSNYKCLGARNGHGIYFADTDESLQPELRKYHFSMVWDPDPFISWRYAYLVVKPLIGTTTVTDPGAVFEAVFEWPPPQQSLTLGSKARIPAAVTRALRNGGHHHPLSGVAWSSISEERKIWDSAGRLPPKEVLLATSGGLQNYVPTTLSDILASRFGGCFQTVGVLISVFRSLGLAARVVLWQPGPMHGGNPVFAFSPDAKSATGFTLGVDAPAGLVDGHHLVHVPGLKLGLLHGDDACGYRGLHFGDPSLVWVAEGFFFDAMGFYCTKWDPTPNLGQVAMWALLIRIREALSRDSVFRMAYTVDWASDAWAARVVSVCWATNDEIAKSWKDLTGMRTKVSWCDAALAVLGNQLVTGRPTSTAMEICRRFFGLDYDDSGQGPQAYNSLKESLAVGNMQKTPWRILWGMPIFPLNFNASNPAKVSPSVQKYGLAADPEIVKALGNFAMKMNDLKSLAFDVGPYGSGTGM